jgi:peptidyl-prolyl cis-trans isomerase SurA
MKNVGIASVCTFAAATFIAVLIPVSVCAQSKNAVAADIVARVNDDVITLSDYQKAEQQLHEEVARDCQGCPQDKIDAQFKEQQKDLLRGLIDQSLMVQRAKDMGVNVDADLNKKLDDVRKQNGLATLEELQKGVEANGLSWEDYKTTMRNGLLTKEVVRREVGAHIDISSDEVKQYYAAHPQEFTQPEEVVLSEIVLSTEGKNAEDTLFAQKRAEALRNRLMAGDDFSETARRYSEGSTAKDGGALGTFKRGELPSQLEEVVFKMDKGQITEVIQTKTGFEILKVDNHLQAGLQPMDKVDSEIRNSLYVQKMEPRMRDYLGLLREQSYVIVKRGYSDSAMMAGASAALPGNLQL